MILLLTLSAVLVASFAVLAGTYVFFLTQGSPTPATTVPADLPGDVFVCDHFVFGRAAVRDTGSGSRIYDVGGACPVSASVLEYRGWTVHRDSSGGVDAYQYQTREQLTLTFTSSESVANQTTVDFIVVTRQAIPPGFPTPAPSPLA
jgi:hypothetical protein